jgi:hypothetical protein
VQGTAWPGTFGLCPSDSEARLHSPRRRAASGPATRAGAAAASGPCAGSPMRHWRPEHPRFRSWTCQGDRRRPGRAPLLDLGQQARVPLSVVAVKRGRVDLFRDWVLRCISRRTIVSQTIERPEAGAPTRVRLAARSPKGCETACCA